MKCILLVLLYISLQCSCEQKIVGLKLYRKKGATMPSEYYTKVSVGSPQTGQTDQVTTLIVDTGSPHMWVLSVKGKHRLPVYANGEFFECDPFDHTKSTTFDKSEANFTLAYGDGTTTMGYVASDWIKIEAGEASLVVQDQTFGLADFVSKPLGASGMLGLGLFSEQEILPFDPDPPLWSVIKQHPIAPEFGIFLNRFGSENGDNGGMLTLGGHDPELIDGEFTFHDVRKEWGEYVGWTVQLDQLTIEKDSKLVQDFPLPANTNAVLDSGSNIIVGPLASVVRLHRAIFKNSDADYSKPFKFACDGWQDLPDVVFTIDGHKYVLTPKDYVYGIGQKSVCRSLFLGKALHTQFLLGHPFMEKYYTKFDLKNQRIGLAKARLSS